MLERLAGLITGPGGSRLVQIGHPVRVAIDGVDASGKTTLANELAEWVARLGCPVIRASVDGFHRPRQERHRRGAGSPEGYFYDAFDYPAVRQALLTPLGPKGDRCYRTAAFDFRTDTPVRSEALIAPENAILLFDGVFLLRPELNDGWDFRIFVDVDFETCLSRACRRDLDLFGSAEETRRRYEQRYIPGQRIYMETVDPRSKADVIVDNRDPAEPAFEILR